METGSGAAIKLPIIHDWSTSVSWPQATGDGTASTEPEATIGAPKSLGFPRVFP